MSEQLKQENSNKKNIKFKAVIYATLSSWTSVLSDVRGVFKPILKGYRCAVESRKEMTIGENYMEIKLIDDTIVAFSAIHDNDKATEHIYKLGGFVNRLPYGPDEERENMVRKVLDFNYILSVEFDINSDNDRSVFLVDLLCQVADKLNGYVFMTQKGVSTFINGKGEKVFPKI